jgi:hypothetical protein
VQATSGGASIGRQVSAAAAPICAGLAVGRIRQWRCFCLCGGEARDSL